MVLPLVISALKFYFSLIFQMLCGTMVSADNMHLFCRGFQIFLGVLMTKLEYLELLCRLAF